MVSNPHPIDLLIISPVSLIVEANIVRDENPLYAVREAVGQLHEYRYFVGRHDSKLCILLDTQPDGDLIRHIEEELRLFVLWCTQSSIVGGPRTTDLLKV
jgi:hypothetical protein